MAMVLEKGIALHPHPLQAGELVKITYTGLLAQSGAEQVFLHMGYGDAWDGVMDLPMQRVSEGWQRVFPVQKGTRLNFCFKDSAENWDNNNGRNWSVDIHQPNL